MRRHPPQLVNPRDTVSAATDRALGIRSEKGRERRLNVLERLAAQHDREIGAERQEVANARSVLDTMALEDTGPYGPPTISAAAAAGSTATATITGTDEEGIIVLTPGGSGITTGTQATITFMVPKASASYTIHLQEFSAAARTAGSTVGPTNRSASSWILTTGTALTSGSVYQWFYKVGKVYA